MSPETVRRLAVVTGATGGIGQEICRRAALAGFDIVAHYHSDREGAEALRRNVQDARRSCHIVQADLAEESGVDEICAVVEDLRASDDTVELQALINNAAKLLSPSFDEATVADFDAYFALNARAPFFLSQRLSKQMPHGASIVNISSASAHFSSPGDIIYAMSKSTVEAMTKNSAEALAARGIRVNAVVPGFTDNGHPAFADPRALDYMSSFAVLGGVGAPTHVADAVLFLISDAAARTTGSILDISGGSTLGSRGSRLHSVRELL